MKVFKKTVRLLGLFILIILASVGIAIGGGIPIPPGNKKEENIEVSIELEDDSNDNTQK